METNDESNSRHQQPLMIAGYPVHFPFPQPYPAQLCLISKALNALSKKQNAMLESPTGTGKSMALLCSVLAYQQSQAKLATRLDDIVVPKVYFMSRTHTQLTQVVRELARTTYRPKMTILGSREQYCINKHPTVNANDHCKRLLAEQKCSAFHNMFRLRSVVASNDNVWDIEDLITGGQRLGACPYYTARALADEHAELILCPYNYIIDPSIRKSVNLNLQHSILVFDESHNIASVARESATAVFTEKELLDVQQRVKQEPEWATATSCVEGLMQIIDHYENSLQKRGFHEEAFVLQSQNLLDALTETSFTIDRVKELKQFLHQMSGEDKIDDYIESSGGSSNVAEKGFAPTLAVVERICQVLSLLFSGETSFKNESYESIRHYRLVIRRCEQSDTGDMQKTIEFICLSPSVVMRPLNSAHSLIIASGTLHPLSSLTAELGVEFHERLEAPHVISKEQVVVGVIGAGPNGLRLSATYQDAKTVDFQNELGESLLQICKVVPDGVLVFFPSYALLDRLKHHWTRSGMYRQLAQEKSLFVESRRGGNDFDNDVDRYRNICNHGSKKNKGAIFFAVCRGKLSEGIDFADRTARAVVLVGIPYPNSKDIQVELKKKHNDMEVAASRATAAVLGNDKVPSGHAWYKQQAFRALNQAIGRCIRHRNDYGAVLLVDVRFHDRQVTNQLCKWIRPHITHLNEFSKLLSTLQNFYSNMNVKFPHTTTIQQTTCTEQLAQRNVNISTLKLKKNISSGTKRRNEFELNKQHNRKKGPLERAFAQCKENAAVASKTDSKSPGSKFETTSRNSTLAESKWRIAPKDTKSSGASSIISGEAQAMSKIESFAFNDSASHSASCDDKNTISHVINAHQPVCEKIDKMQNEHQREKALLHEQKSTNIVSSTNSHTQKNLNINVKQCNFDAERIKGELNEDNVLVFDTLQNHTNEVTVVLHPRAKKTTSTVECALCRFALITMHRLNHCQTYTESISGVSCLILWKVFVPTSFQTIIECTVLPKHSHLPSENIHFHRTQSLSDPSTFWVSSHRLLFEPVFCNSCKSVCGVSIAAIGRLEDSERIGETWIFRRQNDDSTLKSHGDQIQRNETYSNTIAPLLSPLPKKSFRPSISVQDEEIPNSNSESASPTPGVIRRTTSSRMDRFNF